MKLSTHLPHSVRFGDFELDTRAGQLRAGNGRIHLQDQPLQILLMLLEHPGELVTREALHNALWPGNSFGDVEDSLNHAVRRLRDALGDLAEHPKFIETLARRGYRFIAPVVGADGVQRVVGATRGVAQGEAAPRPYKVSRADGGNCHCDAGRAPRAQRRRPAGPLDDRRRGIRQPADAPTENPIHCRPAV